MAGYAADGFSRAAGEAREAGTVSAALDAAGAAIGAPAQPVGVPQGDAVAAGAGEVAETPREAGAPAGELPPSAGPDRGVATVSQARISGPIEGAERIFQDGVCIHEGNLECFLISEPVAVESVLLERAADQAGGQPNSGGETPANMEGFRLGASSRSGAGESLEAGRGSQAIGGGEAADPDAFDAGGDLTLTSGRRAGEGNQIRFDRAPEAAVAEGDVEAAAGTGAWRRLAEDPVSRNQTTLGQAATIDRYFRPVAD
jgi:hypothetical protein